MTLVATLISNPCAPAITEAVLREARAALGTGHPAHRLHGEIAADILFEGPAEGGSAALGATLAGQPIDIVVQPAKRRRKRLFLADMDSTMIEQECIDELADYVGLKPEVAAITERAMRGEIAFEPALRERVALLEGLPASVIDEIIAKRIRITAGARTLLGTMRAHGAHTCLVSGGFTLFTGPIAERIGFDEHRSNRLAIANEKLAGHVEEPILGSEAKFAALVELRERLGLSREDTMAVGDGANDLAMLEEAGLGVAFHAKPVVAAAAHARIDHGDLTALLYIQGYTAAELVEG